MSEWMPIETAPKDGTLVLLCIAGFQPVLGNWFTRELPGLPLAPRWITFDPTGVFEDDWELASYLHGCSYEPTHWMPLPEPPLDVSKE